MEGREIFRSSVATINYDEQFKLVYLTWHCNGGMSFEKYKEPFEFLLDRTQIQIYGILSDIRRQSIIGTEMRRWLQKEATPRAIKRGLHCYYAVSDNNASKLYYLNTIFKLLAGDSIDKRIFQDYDEARQGIKEAISRRLENAR